MKKSLYLTIATFTTLTMLFVAVPAQADLFTDQKTAVQQALTWLKSQQNDDGGFGRPYSGAYITAQAVLALAAANEDSNQWQKNGHSPMDYLSGLMATTPYTLSGGQTGLLICAVVAGNGHPRDFAGRDLVSYLNSSQYDSSSGKFSGLDVSDQGWAMLGLAAAMEPIPAKAVTWLKNQQQAGGNWTYSDPNPRDVDITARAMQALIAAGEPPTSTVMIEATNYLSTTQSTTDSGMPQRAGQDSNTNSTAYTIQALIARGENPLGAVWSKSSNPLTFLLSMQQPDGSFKWIAGEAGDTLLATVQAIPALMGRPFPLRGRLVAALKAIDFIKTKQNDDGGFPQGLLLSGPESEAGGTASAVYAFAVNCEAPDRVKKNDKSPLDFLATQAALYTAAADATSKMIIATVLGNRNPRNFGGVDLVDRLNSFASPSVGYGNFVKDQTWSVWALNTMRASVPVTPANWLRSSQTAQGAWGWNSPPFTATAWCSPTVVISTTEPSATAWAIQALIASGEPVVGTNSVVIDNAFNYLKTTQNPDGGFLYTNVDDGCGFFDPSSNVFVTSYVIQALLAAGRDSESWDWARHMTGTNDISMTVHTPMYHLLNLQLADGSFPWTTTTKDTTSIAATYEAVPALLGKYFPLLPCQNRAYLPEVTQNITR